MTLIRCIIWLLLVFVVIATLDSQPDPPAINPSGALCKFLPHNDACNTATERNISFTTSSPFRVSLIAADACEPDSPTDRMILTAQAADPSPPVRQAARKLSFRS